MNGTPLELFNPSEPPLVTLAFALVLVGLSVWNIKQKNWRALFFSGFFAIGMLYSLGSWLHGLYEFTQQQKKVDCYIAHNNGWTIPKECDTIEWKWMINEEER